MHTEKQQRVHKLRYLHSRCVRCGGFGGSFAPVLKGFGVREGFPLAHYSLM